MNSSEYRQRADESEQTATPEGAATPATEEGEGETAPLPLDQIFDLLKNERRRLVLLYLKDNEEPASTSDLAEHIAAYETDKSVDRITSKERKRAYVGLYQSHLPKMDSMDVIDFNKQRGIVHLGENEAVVDPYLDVARNEGDDDTAWATRYLALATLAVISLLGAATLGNSFVLTVGFGAVVLSFWVCSLLHIRSQREGD